MSTSDDVVIRLRLADVAKFVADVKAGTLSIDQLEKKIKQAGRTAKESSSNYGGLGIWGATVGRMKYAVAGLALAAGSGAVALATFALKSTASLEQVRIGFGQLLGSTGAADKMVSMLQDFAKRTPFNFQDVTTMTQKLLAFGEPAENIKGTLTAIGNAVSAFGGSSADMDGIITAFGQVAMKGHLAGQEVLQLNNHMINAKQYLMDALHVSGPELAKMMEKGQIGSAQAISIIQAGMQAKFAGMMDVQSQTLGGIWNNMFDAFQQSLVNTTTPHLPQIKQFAQWLLDHIPAIMDSATHILGVIGKFGVALYHIASSPGAIHLFVALKDTIGYIATHIWWVGILYNWLSSPGTPGLISDVLNGIAVFVENPVVQTFLTGIGGYALAMWGFASATDATAASLGRLKRAAAFLAIIPKGAKLTGVIGAGMGAAPALTGTAALKALLPAVFASTAIVGVAGMLAYRFSGEFRKRWDGMWADMTHGSWLSRVGGFFKGIGSFLGAAFVNGFNDTMGVFTGIWHAIVKIVTFDIGKALKDGFIDVINWIVDQWNRLADSSKFTVPGTSTTFGLPDIGHIGGAADGGTTTSDGLLRVGERGPELLDLPRGASVIPLPRAGEFTRGADMRPVVLVADGVQIAKVVNKGNDTQMARL